MTDVLPNISLDSVWYILLAVSKLPTPPPANKQTVNFNSVISASEWTND